MPSFYRVAKRFPPGDEEYLAPRDKGRSIRPGATNEERRAWSARSAFDTGEGARRVGRRYPTQPGTLIVRYDVPEGTGTIWEQTFGPGHYSLWGETEQLKRYLVLDSLTEVRRSRCHLEERMDRYEIMDMASFTLLGVSDTEEEALAVVRELLDANDPSWAEDLAIGHERSDGSPGETIFGAVLLARIEQVAAPAR